MTTTMAVSTTITKNITTTMTKNIATNVAMSRIEFTPFFRKTS